MQVKIQSLLKSILAMSLIVHATGCTVSDAGITPSLISKVTSSPLPQPTS